ncbi:ShlB/FhaC/HecB family hemolysin secretion/activation protein [Rhodoferax sp. TBRC 17199]|nr:ShlB/FhaC/HecB family hemolysin secretion/activation protein [Rhodoferax sp. TBRC 17199]
MALCALSIHAQTQTTPDPSLEQRREQQRIQAQRQELERTADVTSTATRQDASLIPTSESPCFKIERIELDNADYPQGSGIPHPNPVFTETFDWLIAATAGVAGNDSPIGKCLGTVGVQLVIKRAQEAAVAKGFVTTRVLAQRQDLSTGTLVLTVIPGHVGAIRFKGTDADQQISAHVRTSNAVPLRSGDILNLRDIEQGLENFKRVPTAEADIQIEPAQDVNAINQSDLVIAYQQPRMTRWSLSLDDSGSKGTGRYQGSGTFSLDNPLGMSDLFYLTLNHDLNQELGHELGNTQQGDRGTRGYTVHYSLPLDYWTLGTTYSSSRYYQQVVGQNQNYIYSGTSENSEIKLSRLVYRDAVRKSTLSLKGWQRKSNNYIDDTEVQNQRRVVGGWEFGLNHKDMWGDASVEGSLAYKRGTKDFDSMPAPEETFGEGTSKLGLLLLDVNISKPFKAVGQNFRYSAALRLQDNTTPLTPQDRFAIGGRYTVRGFDGESSLVGERGWTLRNDWSMALGDSGHEVYLGLDAGEVSGPSSQNLAGKHLAGGVIGLKGSFKRFKTAMQYDLFVGAPIDKPSGFKTAETAAGFSLSMSF